MLILYIFLNKMGRECNVSVKMRDGEAQNEKICIAIFPLSAVVLDSSSGAMCNLQIFSHITKQYDDLLNSAIVIDYRIDYKQFTPFLFSSNFHRF